MTDLDAKSLIDSQGCIRTPQGRFTDSDDMLAYPAILASIALIVGGLAMGLVPWVYRLGGVSIEGLAIAGLGFLGYAAFFWTMWVKQNATKRELADRGYESVGDYRSWVRENAGSDQR